MTRTGRLASQMTWATVSLSCGFMGKAFRPRGATQALLRVIFALTLGVSGASERQYRAVDSVF